MRDIGEDIETGDVERFEFGIIGFDADYAVRVYNKAESVAAGLRSEKVLRFQIFDSAAPC